MNPKNERLTPNQAYLKIEKFCYYQERHQNEVRSKLFTYGLASDDVEEIISKLIQKGLLNEERYSKLFAGGKFRQKKWGRIKIKQELKLKGISERNIKTGLLEINFEDYEKTLKELIEKLKVKYKKPGLKEWQKKQLVIKALNLKGYETDIILSLYESMNE